MPARALNTRVLVIDDEPGVRDAFTAVLMPKRRPHTALDAAARAFYGDESSPAVHTGMNFSLDLAEDGTRGLTLVEAAMTEGRPYAVVFCDVRMPGIDGLETVERLRRIDPRAEVVFVTAYSDHSLEELTQRVGADVLYLAKPFAVEEVRQLTTKLLMNWNRARDVERMLSAVATAGEGPKGLEGLQELVLRETSAWLNAKDAALLRSVGGSVRFLCGQGAFANEAAVMAFPSGEFVLEDGTRSILAAGGALTLIARCSRSMSAERRHLLHLLLEHAASVYAQVEARERARARERLAAVGEAFSFVLHDLRGPIGFLQMLTRMLRAGDESVWSRERMLQAVDARAQEVLDMIEDFLSLLRGRREVLLETVQLHDTLREPLELWQMTFSNAGITFRAELPEGISLRGDSRALRRALWNLLSNAQRVLGGRDGALVECFVRRNEEHQRVVLCVRDNGPGIPAEVRARLVGDEQVTSPGTPGFGLLIVRQITEAHGGVFSFESSAQGTEFRIELPML